MHIQKKKKLLFDKKILELTINRLCQHLIENHDQFKNTVLIGLQPRGTQFALRIKNRLMELLKCEIHCGFLDITFYRDDFRRSTHPLSPNSTKIDFLIEGKKVVLIDDVLCTGRTVRSALDALTAFGRPEKIELLVLIDRTYNRELPIEPTYIGIRVNTLDTQKIITEIDDNGFNDKIWIVDK
ncbi:MAG: PyrR protein [Bacteroidetes bacterium RIFCSPLOWO2_02_FULL_36_8]|nr:MAG: PyrR protein [Bacteroidetes bacterium RIFCSPLOWO2_02_FULL_36_8]OFY69271.1 MAG: PyrR protein [Bacteroidetes bacterium RIFCSPLOWO2_12_FULL_37_12]